MSSPDSAKICSSDLESQPQSVTFDDDYKDFPTPNSEDLAPPSSDNECVLDSAEFGSASSIGSCKSHPEHKGRPEMTEKTEEQPQKTKKRLRMLDEDGDGVRIKVIPDFRKQFRARMTATQQLQDDFYIPNRAQLMLNFLKKHGDRVAQETRGPKRRFSSTLQLVQRVLKKNSATSSGRGLNPIVQESDAKGTRTVESVMPVCHMIELCCPVLQ